MGDLARQIVRDGEGATKFITVNVTGAATDRAAKAIAMAIANSPLVKTAVAGEDANWGRIVMAVGKAGERVDTSRLSVRVGGVRITDRGGVRKGYREGPVARHMKGRNIDIHVDAGLKGRRGRATVWTCDLTHDYIAINADYRS
jgi:glutamate N-acetyltransferase/amino-acid N-acetyltransferase